MKNPSEPNRRTCLTKHAHILGALLLSASAATAEVHLTFDTDTQGVTLGGNATALAHSTKFGGSVAVTGGPGFNQNMAFLNLRDAGALQAELEAALASGIGYIRYTIRIEQTDVITGNPGWFEGICVGNSRAGYDQNVGGGQGVFGTPPFPLSETFTTTVTMPVTAVPLPDPIATGPKTNIGGNGGLEFPLNSDGEYYQLLIGLNSGGDGYTGATYYVDDIIVSAGAVPPPPAAAAYTFDATKEGFVIWPYGGGGEGTVTYTTDFGGAVQMGIHTSYWNLQKVVNTGTQLTNLQACINRGGNVSFDIIGPVGTLSGKGFSVTLQNFANYDFTQVNPQMNAASVQPLPGGVYEIGRINIPIGDFGKGLVPAGGFNFFVGYNPLAVPAPLYIDNVMFAPYGSNGGKLTFDSSEQNFTEEPGAVLGTSADGVVIVNPPGDAIATKAQFNATTGAADAQVLAVKNALDLAAVKGGVLRFKVKSIVLDNPVGFGGMNVIAVHNNSSWQARYNWVGSGTFTVNSGSETPTTYTQTFTIPLYPPGSTQTDGYVLDASATNYEFLIGTQANNVDGVTLTFDDFEVIPNADPDIIYTPALPASGSAVFIGRALSNAQTYGVFSATGLPPGVTIDPATGLIYGTPTLNGTYNVVISVTAAGVITTADTINWVVTGAADPVLAVITSFSISGNTAVITWSGTGATPVTVHRSETLAGGSWTAVSTANTTGTFTDTSAPAGKAFYRVSVP